MRYDIGIEFGERNVRLATRESGVSLISPSTGATRGDSVFAMGDEAEAMRGRAPRGVTLSYPVRSGAISDARLAAKWLARLMEPFTSAGKLHKPSLIIADSGLYKPGELELIKNTALELGAAKVNFMRCELLQALGAGQDVLAPEGRMVINAGAGMLFAAVISFGRVALSRTLPYGFSRIDDEIALLVRREHALSIGERTSEELKLALASCLPAPNVTALAAGLDMKTGFPSEAPVSAELVSRACEGVVAALTALSRSAMALAPGELCVDLLDNGAVLTGGGARMTGLDARIAAACGINCAVAEDPENACVAGLARVLKSEPLSELAGG